MKNLKKLFYLAIVASLSITSCAKEEEAQDDPIMDPPMEEVDITEVLTGNSEKTWSATAFTLAGTTQDCRMDDTFTFNLDNTYSYNGGDNLCGAEDNAQIKSGTWTLDENEENIIFDEGTDYEYSAAITTAGHHELVLTGSYLMMTVSGSYTH